MQHFLYIDLKCFTVDAIFDRKTSVYLAQLHQEYMSSCSYTTKFPNEYASQRAGGMIPRS